MQETMKERAKALLADGTVDRVLGWKKGEFSYDETPAVFRTAEEIDRDFIYDGFSSPNLSKYLVGECKKGGKILAFMKPCDTYSIAQLLTEHRVAREMLYLIAIPCDGKLDADKIRTAIAGAALLGAEVTDGKTLMAMTPEGKVSLHREDMLADRCLCCKSKKHTVYDELLGQEGEAADSHRFDMVEKLEAMTPEERYAFWQEELSKCIRCNACRNACPACTCETCIFDNPNSGSANKAAADPFEDQMFHIIRAFHVAGRCTDCGECSRVCPQHIPLHLLNRKFIKDINSLYGDYQAGTEVGNRSPLVDYTQGDADPDIVREGKMPGKGGN